MHAYMKTYTLFNREMEREICSDQRMYYMDMCLHATYMLYMCILYIYINDKYITQGRIDVLSSVRKRETREREKEIERTTLLGERCVFSSTLYNMYHWMCVRNRVCYGLGVVLKSVHQIHQIVSSSRRALTVCIF